MNPSCSVQTPHRALVVSPSQPGAPAPQINDPSPPFMCHPQEYIKHFSLAAAGGSKIPAQLPPPEHFPIFAFEISFDITRWPQPRP